VIAPPDGGHCDSAQDEYWYHVSPQDNLPIAPGIPRPGTLERVATFLRAIDADTLPHLPPAIAEHLLADPSSLDGMRLLAGLSDKRLYLDLSYRLSRRLRDDGHGSLCGCEPNQLTRHTTSTLVGMLHKSPVRDEVAAEVAQYLTDAGLHRLALALSVLDGGQREGLVMSFVASTEAQQSEAKRRGHGAEAALASLLLTLGVTVVPADKAANPMGSYDPNFDANRWKLCDRVAGTTYSADLALLDETGSLAVCVQGLIHSSDPGQFGVDKSNQTVDIRRILDQTGQGQLWGLVDGVGYSENKTGTINKLLMAFHKFGQVNSLYKFGLACHSMGLTQVSAIALDPGYPERCRAAMIEKYVPSDVEILASADPPHGLRPIGAGWGTLFVNG
jgi:hypothetical protein